MRIRGRYIHGEDIGGGGKKIGSLRCIRVSATSKETKGELPGFLPTPRSELYFLPQQTEVRVVAHQS